MKRQLEFDNATLAQRCEKANEQHARDQETIADLNDRISDPRVTRTSSFYGGGLDGEISQVTKTEEQLQVSDILLFWSRLTSRNRISRLEFQNRQLQKCTDEQVAKSVLHQQLLDFRQDELHQLETRVSKLTQEKLEAEASLAVIRGDDPIEGCEAFLLVGRSITHTFCSSEVYHRMRADRDAVKQRNAQLQTDYELLHQKHADLQGDAGKGQRTLPSSQEAVQAAISNDDIKAAFEHLKAVAVSKLKDGAPEAQRALEKRIASLADMVIDSREQQIKDKEVPNSSGRFTEHLSQSYHTATEYPYISPQIANTSLLAHPESRSSNSQASSPVSKGSGQRRMPFNVPRFWKR